MSTKQQHPGSDRRHRGDEFLEFDCGGVGWFRLTADHAHRLLEGRLLALLPCGNYAIVANPQAAFRSLVRRFR